MEDVTRPSPAESATEPIYTKGNFFWRGDKRFLARGICYFPTPAQRTQAELNSDLLADVRLEDLKRDIDILREVGFNTILVRKLDSTKNHRKAFELLHQAGIYVLVELCENIVYPPKRERHWYDKDDSDDVAALPPEEMLKQTFRIVDELADYPNLLGCVLDGGRISWRNYTPKMAETIRAAVADVTAFVRLRGGRNVPVGVRFKFNGHYKVDITQYLVAGVKEERIDFLTLDCWAWMGKSSFKISGWENMVSGNAQYPVPMFLGAFGTPSGNKPREWHEILTLYSADMTGIFSGGFVYEYFPTGDQGGHSKWSIVKFRDEGAIEKKPEFATLKKRFITVSSQSEEEMCPAKVKDYESWTGDFPESIDGNGQATSQISSFIGSWDNLIQEMRQERQQHVTDKFRLMTLDSPPPSQRVE